MKKEIKVEWCEAFIRAAFTKHHAFPGLNAGIEVGFFWKMAEASGLYERGAYNGPMTRALENLTDVESVATEIGGKRVFMYNVFKLKQ